MEYEIIKRITKNEKLILSVTKILIICFISYSLLGSIEAFYEGSQINLCKIKFVF